MENNELIKRYIYAVINHLPQKAQADVEKELESIISDMLDARCGENAPSEADAKAVLTELGSPAELAVKYSGGEGKALISGVYFLWWKRIFKIVVPIVAIVCAFAAAIAAFTEITSSTTAADVVSEFITGIITGGIEGALQSAFIITLVFAILERSKADITGKDFLGKLHPVPPQRARIKLHDPIMNICWNILVAVLFLAFPYMIGGYSESTGWVAAFNNDHIRAGWFLVVLWAALGIGKEIFKLCERRYSIRLAVVTTVANVLTGIGTGVLFLNRNIVNAAFIDTFQVVFEEDGHAAEVIAGNVNVILFGIIMFALLLETGITLYRALRYDR